MPLHPDAAAFLARMANSPQPNEIPIAKFRDAAAALIASGPKLVIGSVRDAEIAGGDGQPLAIRIYPPAGGGPFPIVVWAHGGSFVRGTLEMFDAGRRAFVKASNCIVVAVDQRLSPETQFPGPLEDVYAALVWAHAKAKEFDGDSTRLGVAGESSGANLAAAAAILARDRGAPPLRFQLLLEPLLDARCDTPSMRELADGYVLTQRQLVWAYEQYAPGVPRETPILSPLLGKLEGLPPTAIITIEFDPVRDDGELYAVRLRSAGIPVASQRIAGMLHHFPGPEMVPTAARLLAELLGAKA
jgi:acetyl esterase